ncbi:MAG: hypothetical protein ACLUVC_13520 [Longibaculum sp.]
MGLFSKKKKETIDYDAVFKEQYKSINQLMMQAHEELDFVIKESLLKMIVEKYNELLTLIDQGAHFEKDHFEALKQSACQELETIQNINKDI